MAEVDYLFSSFLSSLSLFLFAATSFLSILYWTIVRERPHSGFDTVGQKLCEPPFLFAKWRFFFSFPQLLSEGIKKCKGPFQIFTPVGMKILLPAKYIRAICNHKHLVFAPYLEHDQFASYPGFGGFHAATTGNIMQDTIKRKLTPSLNHLTEFIAEDVALAIPKIYPAADEWNESITLYDARELIARSTTRIFMGDNFHRDPRWLNLILSYTKDIFTAMVVLRCWPSGLRSIIQWVLPITRRLRREEAEITRIITSALDKSEEHDGPEHVPSFDGGLSPAFSWLKSTAESKGHPSFSLAQGQLSLASSSIFPTSGLLTNILYDLAENPDCVEILRKEIKVAVAVNGWNGSALDSMRLLDSVMKESHRLRSFFDITMHRQAQESVCLPGGIILPRNSMVAIVASNFMDSGIYDHPERFDAHRFLELRKQDERKWRFESTSEEHVGFGHGRHACPGRFFVSNVVKIVLAQLLLNYDWKLPQKQGRPKDMNLGPQSFPNPHGVILFKKRSPYA